MATFRSSGKVAERERRPRSHAAGAAYGNVSSEVRDDRWERSPKLGAADGDVSGLGHLQGKPMSRRSRRLTTRSRESPLHWKIKLPSTECRTHVGPEADDDNRENEDKIGDLCPHHRSADEGQ